ncbi:MAG: hypothetical protein COA70_13235 [Planctomycetota bacterium]|nr:MAG: hypothetical protein COA70_13235 [Planctomycetota bacterium]
MVKQFPLLDRSCLIVVSAKQPPRARGAIRNSAIKVGTYCWVLWLDSKALDNARARYRLLCEVKIPDHPIGITKVLRKSIQKEHGVDLDAIRYEDMTPFELLKGKQRKPTLEIYDEVSSYPKTADDSLS